jgi:hypothetical protein
MNGVVDVDVVSRIKGGAMYSIRSHVMIEDSFFVSNHAVMSKPVSSPGYTSS